MVHRSGSTHQCVELVENDEPNEKSNKNDLVITDSFKASVTSNSTAEHDSKRQSRTSKRLSSVNSTDVMTPPKTSEFSSTSKWSTTPVTIKPRPIRNRRYTVNDCIRPIERNITVPFLDQSKNSNLSPTDDNSTKAKSSIKSYDDLYNFKKDKLHCSVSLERLSGIGHTSTSDRDDITNSPDNSEKVDSVTTNKILCLYCDRSFASSVLYTKHVERMHQSKSGRRFSARTSTNSATTSNYIGCFYCNVGKVTCLESGELSQLVHHLVQRHSDKYFTCEECLIRFQTHELLLKHSDIVHGCRNTKNQTDITAVLGTDKIVQSSLNVLEPVTPLTVEVDFETNELRNRLRRSNDLKNASQSERSSRKQFLSSEEMFLSRLGIGLNRSPRSRKGAKNRRGCSSELFQLENSRSTRGNKNSNKSSVSSESIESSKSLSGKIESISAAFDEDFYEQVNQNVKRNLSCHLDGKLESGPMSPSPLSPVANITAVRSVLVKSPLVTEAEIHEATTISAFTAFPTLLTAQQYGGESLTAGKIKKPITKHSWKWKWDCVKKYKYVNEGGKIVKKIKQSTSGMRDLSTIDMWTQLTMRTRHENVMRQESVMSGENNILGVGEAAREEKRKLIEQLNKILDTRVLPKIKAEQNDQTIIKLEVNDSSRTIDAIDRMSLPNTSTSIIQNDQDFPASINLVKRNHSPGNTETSLILSGEWARPRSYICVGCGSIFSTVRSLEEHKSSKHPLVHSTHYEIVGKELIDGDLFRNFYIPSMALKRHNQLNKKQFLNSICSAEDSMDSVTSYSMSLTKSDSFDLDSNSRNSKTSISSGASISDRSYSMSTDEENANSSTERSTSEPSSVCSKCGRKCKGISDLYRHILDCSNDYAWILAKKRNNIKYRYFGVRRRRQQRSASSSVRKVRPKKERHNSDTSGSQKDKEPTTPRQRPSDAESIQRMLANLPAKRAVRQIIPNLTQKPNNKNKKNKILMPKSLSRKKTLLKQKTKVNARGYSVVSTPGTTINSVGANLALRKKRNADSVNAIVRRTRASLSTKKDDSKSDKISGNKPSGSSVAKSSPTIPTETKIKKKMSDIGNVFRRRTKAVVSKISNSLIRGQNQRKLRTAKSSPNTSINAKNAKLKQSNPISKRKKTFLRTLSSRRSNRNRIKTMKSEPEKPSNGVKADLIGDDQLLSTDKNSSTSLKNEENKCNIEETNQSSSITNHVEEEAVKQSISPVVRDVPRLKRKRSIKTILNEMRAKCQDKSAKDLREIVEVQTKVPESPPLAEALIPSNKDFQVDSNRTNSPIIQVPVSPSVTMPLSLTIESIDEPLNLCTSPQKNTNCLASSSSNASESKSSLSTPNAAEIPDTISPRRRTRKLNDCIAMLTGKLQEKLGVPFIDQTSSLLPILSPSSEVEQAEPKVSPTLATKKIICEEKERDSAIPDQERIEKKPEPEKDVKPIVVQECSSVSSDICKIIASKPIKMLPPVFEDIAELEKINSSITKEISIISDQKTIQDVQSKNCQLKTNVVELEKKSLNEQMKPKSETNLKIMSTESIEQCITLTTNIVEQDSNAEIKNDGIMDTKGAGASLASKDETPPKSTGDLSEAAKKKSKNDASKDILPMKKDNLMIESVQEPTTVLVEKSVEKVVEKTSEKIETSDISKDENSKTRKIKDDCIERFSTEERSTRRRKTPVKVANKSTKRNKKAQEEQTKKSSKKAVETLTNKENSLKMSEKSTKSIEVEIVKSNEINIEKPSNAVSSKVKDVHVSTTSSKKGKKSITPEKHQKQEKQKKKEQESKTENSKIKEKVNKNITKSDGSGKKSKRLEKIDINASIFDNSDEELLPWDAEKGFTRTKTTDPDIKISATTSIENPKINESCESNDLDAPTVAPKTKKKRKSELAQIIADQLLESFKEVDKSRIDELKKIHDLSLSSSEDLISKSLSTTPIPKRRAKKLFEDIEPTNRKKAADNTKVGSQKNNPPENIEDTAKKEVAVEAKESVGHPTKRAEKKSQDLKQQKEIVEKAPKIHEKKKNNMDINATKQIMLRKVQTTEPNVKAESSQFLFEITLKNDINKKSPIVSSTSNIQSSTGVEKLVEKHLFGASNSATIFSMSKRSKDDTTSSASDMSKKSNSIFEEVLQSQQSSKTERLSDIIGLSDKEALSRVPSIKNVVFSQWPMEKASSASDTEKILHLNDNKTCFWSRTNAPQMKDGKVDAKKSKIFVAMKSKARDLFSKISKKKSKKSRVGIKTKIRSSSSSSSSSSTSSSSSSDVPKKPLLRPSILSCNSFRDLVHVENSLSSTTTTKATNDIFDSLRKSSAEAPKPVSLSPQKLNSRQKTKNEKNMIVKKPKSPIESDMNIAKIAIALEKSNRIELHNQVKQNLKETSSVDKANFSPTRYRLKRIVSTKSDNKLIPSQTITESEFPQATENDDSQDTIISQIVNKIREKAEKIDSDDEMCLTEATKGLSNKLKQPKSACSAIDLLKLDAHNDLSALVSPSNKMNESHLFTKKDNEKGIKSISTDDENTNTELIDMDLEDNESIYTTFSQSTVATSGGPNRKKRKKKSILSSGRKSKRNQSRQLSSPSATYFCDICQKSFRNQHGLNNHKNTITHISKLSEQEFLKAKEKENDLKNDEIESSETASATPVVNEDEKLDAHMNRQTMPIKSDEPSLKIVVNSSSATHPLPRTSSICSSQISPRVNYIETVPPPDSSSKIIGPAKALIAQSTLNSRLMLSQEERLFYECCSMLKGSDRTTVGMGLTEPIVKPVTPKSTEQNAIMSHAAQSPRSHSSPRPRIHKTNTNSFSDILYDSNPAYSCLQVPSSSETQKIFSLGSPTSSMSPKAVDNIHIGNVCVSPRKSNKEIQSNEKILINGQDCHSNLRNYPDSLSDMGDSFPSSRDASESENYAQTISERSNHFGDDAAKTSLNLPIISQKAKDGSYGSSHQQPSLPNENVDIGSVSNRCTLEPSRPRTKAALKNYENLKVSIPTSGLDIQHALDRSPNANGCKLAALADIALGNDVPLNLIESKSLLTVEYESRNKKPSPSITTKSVMKHTPSFILSSESIKTHSIEIKTKTFESAFNVTSKNKKRTTQSIGEKTGFKERKKGARASSKFPSNPEFTKPVSFKPKDVYDFEESHDSVEDEIVPLTHSRSNKNEPTSAVESINVSEVTKKLNDEEDDESSYSDRDDYYNFNSVSGSGTEDLENPVDDDENSRHAASSQTSKNLSRCASNLQKKCLIMGRIFKNATKNPEPSNVEDKEKTSAEPIPEQELDAIFDNLKNKKSAKEDKPLSTKARSTASKKKNIESDDEKPETDNQLQTSSKPRKSREVANLEAEWGMSVGQIKELIGVGKRKSQRKCASNRQNKFVETWSSDEYEEFHTTKDIIALIQEAEIKALRTKSRLAKQNAETSPALLQSDNENESMSGNPSTNPSIESKEVKKEKLKVKSKADISSNELVLPSNNDNVVPVKILECIKPKTKKISFEKFQSEGESDFDEHWNKTAKRAKIRDRRRTIATREDASIAKDIKNKKQTPEPSNSKKQQMNIAKKCRNVPPAAETNDKLKHTIETPKMDTQKNSKSGNKSKNSKSMTRRKRFASDMLYYWSSSSDDEFGRIQPSDHDDEDNSENHLEQHGWIVGDSHKKLVTLLAHAKGKKIEDCGVKEKFHKKK